MVGEVFADGSECDLCVYDCPCARRIMEVKNVMSLRDKTNALYNAAASPSTTPEEMKSIIDGLKSDKEFSETGALITALQGALHIALMTGRLGDAESRFEVIKVIADAEAENYGGEYFPTLLIQAVFHDNPEYIIRKIIELGVDVNAIDCEKRTAMDYATNNDEVRKILDEAMKKGE